MQPSESTEKRLLYAEMKRDPAWSESVAVGNSEFLEAFQSSASHLRHREISTDDGICSLHENQSPYDAGSADKIGHPRGENRIFLSNNQCKSGVYAGPTLLSLLRIL